MSVLQASVADPWSLELLVASGLTDSERRAVGRDVERGRVLRLWQGVAVERVPFEAMPAEPQHLVRMRALAAVSPSPVLFSHWSAAVLHGLPVLRSRLARVHATIPSEVERHRAGVAHHVFTVGGSERTVVRDLVATAPPRTVVDVAGSSPVEEGVMVADRALLRGLPREVLEAAVDLAGPRRAARRIQQVVAFAHPGAESSAESRTRVTCWRIGVEVPELQRRFVLRNGREAFPDAWFPEADALLEIDGAQKYLDPAMAPVGAGRAVYDEKLREDDLRRQVRAFGRSGWAESGSRDLLRPVLARLGVRPTSPPTPFEAYCAAAAGARPRRPIR